MYQEEKELELDDWGICRHCTEGITTRRIRTGRQWSGPFWRTAWVHVDSGETKCWAPVAHPIDEHDMARLEAEDIKRQE